MIPILTISIFSIRSGLVFVSLCLAIAVASQQHSASDGLQQKAAAASSHWAGVIGLDERTA
jgi:hypothetical protein